MLDFLAISPIFVVTETSVYAIIQDFVKEVNFPLEDLVLLLGQDDNLLEIKFRP